MVELSEISLAIIEGNSEKVVELIENNLEKGVSAQDILTGHLIPGMLEVGRLMEEGEYFIPEVLLSAKVMNRGLEILQPLLAGDSSFKSEGYVILGTVEGDIHDIGKNLVGVLLKGSGFEVLDLGVSVPTEKFVATAEEKKGTIILAMSALITPTMAEMPVVIKAIESAGIRHRVRIMVGGAPITVEFAKSIGADGMTKDAAGAVRLAKELLKV